MATTKTRVAFHSSVNISEDKKAEIIDLLNARLADTIDVRMQTKHAHWNVRGRDFFQLHELFEQIAEHLDEAADSLAERAAALGGVANGTIRMAAAASSIPEYDQNAVEGMEHVRVLSERLARLTNQARFDIDRTADLGDQATSDLLTEIVRETDKDLWFLEAHLNA